MGLQGAFDGYTAAPYHGACSRSSRLPPSCASLRGTGATKIETLVTFIAANPEAGNVVPGSGGLRKVRWGPAGRGKQGGVGVIYYNRLADGEIWLLLIYGKSVEDNIPAHVLRRIKEEMENG